jgi:S-adenosylmethionine:tRNA ribosyltransferase-isomerase
VTPAAWPRPEPLDERLLVVDREAGRWHDRRVRDLPAWLRAGDLLVVNDAATIPASLAAIAPGGARVELRLAAHLGGERWRAVLFGEGDWRTRTEERPPPPRLAPGDVLAVGGADLGARVEEVDAQSPRLVVVRFAQQGARLWAALYRHGRPIQYAHVASPLELWHAQTPFASRPWSVEMPSAGRPLAWALLGELRAKGVGVAALTHAAGLSSTGDPALDALLPLPERFDLPGETVAAIASTRARRGRVVAVGTTVVRALEGCAQTHSGELAPGEGITDLRIGGGGPVRVVDALLTGLHDLGTSHRELLRAFAPEALLARALGEAESLGYRGHEFGDLCLVLAREPRERDRHPYSAGALASTQ